MAAIVAALAALAIAPGTAAPQSGNFVVDTTRDGNDGECAKDCTLREAIALADINSGRWVDVPAGVYKLTLGPLVLGNDVVFGAGFAGNQSSGARTTIIDARGQTRVFELAPGASAVVAGLTITGGNAANGGAALVPADAQLNLYNATVDGNTASQRGGALDVAGDAALFHSTVSNNTAPSGGGVAIEPGGNTAVLVSTVSGNGSGGGIANGGSLQIQNSTIAGNSGGGVVHEGGAAGTAMWSTILAQNSGGDCVGLPHTSGNTFSHNLAGDATCAFTGTEGSNSQDPKLGPLRNNGGPTDTRSIAADSPARDGGDPILCSPGSTPDQRYAPAVGACDIGAFEFGGKPPEPQLPPPVPGETANASVKSGTVKVKLPGSSEYFTLKQGQQVPMGTTFDTTKGRVTLLSAANKAGKTQKGWFYSGVFKLGQTKGKKPVTTLSMTGTLQCAKSGKASAAAKRKTKRRLWGDGKGRFQTRGKHSAATVVGTKWLVEDRCNGTLTKVLRGTVKVRDFKKRKTVTVRAGRSYFAKR